MRAATRNSAAAISALALTAGLMGCSSGKGITDGIAASTGRPATAAGPSDAGSSGPAAGGSTSASSFAGAALRAIEQAKSVKLAATVSALGPQLKSHGELRFESGRTDAHVFVDGGNGLQVEVVVLDGETYTKGLTTDKTKPWTKTHGDTAAMLQAADPRVLLKELQAAATLQSTGTKKINGVDAVGYRGALDLRKVVAQQPGLKDSLQDVIDAGITHSDIQVWADDQSRIVRIATTIKMQGRGSTQTVDFTGWGSPVTITAPPASQVR